MLLSPLRGFWIRRHRFLIRKSLYYERPWKKGSLAMNHICSRCMTVTTVVACCGFAMLAMSHAVAEEPPSVAWIRQVGDIQTHDEGFGLAMDVAGNAYLGGHTTGSVSGPHMGFSDGLLIKFDPTGKIVWSQQFGTSNSESCTGVAVDKVGNVYISGNAATVSSNPDVFVAKYDTTGALLWSSQFGSSAQDTSYGVAVDSQGNAYITGFTYGSLGGPSTGQMNAFLSKFDSAGTQLWSRQIGSVWGEAGRGVAVDSEDNVYISGDMAGDLSASLAGYDAFLTKYDAAGSLLWSRQFGTEMYDFGYGVAVDAACNAYIAGFTEGNLGGLNSGRSDAFLNKYDESGMLLWSRQIGTAKDDASLGVTVDASGNAVITGTTFGSIGGLNQGEQDVFITKYDATGSLLWTHQVGSSGYDGGHNVAIDNAGNVLVGGYTDGSLGGPNPLVYTDAILIKFAVPEPGVFHLLVCGAFPIAIVRRRSARR